MNSKQFQEINGIVECLQKFTQQALVLYTPLVDSVIRSQTKDSKRIEHTLDGILDFAYDEKMLLLFKKLSRYYLTIDPQATYDYINTYREMWDSNSINLAHENVVENMGEGSTNQTELSARKLGEEIKISISKKKEMFGFENETKPIFNLIWNMQKQNTNSLTQEIYCYQN